MVYGLLKGMEDVETEKAQKILNKLHIVTDMWEQSYINDDGSVAKEWTEKNPKEQADYLWSIIINFIMSELEIDEQIHMKQDSYCYVFNPEKIVEVNGKKIRTGKTISIHPCFRGQDGEVSVCAHALLTSSSFFYLEDVEARAEGMKELQEMLISMLKNIIEPIVMLEEE